MRSNSAERATTERCQDYHALFDSTARPTSLRHMHVLSNRENVRLISHGRNLDHARVAVDFAIQLRNEIAGANTTHSLVGEPRVCQYFRTIFINDLVGSRLLVLRGHIVDLFLSLLP